MKKLTVSYAPPFTLTMDGPKGKERLVIRSKYPETELSTFLFRNLGLMHLISLYLPQRIETNFPVHAQFAELIRQLYSSEKRPAPQFSKVDVAEKRFTLPKPDPGMASIAFSSGKDSLWNMWRAEERFGKSKVLAIHIAGLNKHNASDERKAALRQASVLGFRNFAVIDLLNSSRNSGYAVMRSRDMLIIALCVPVALEFGAASVIIEGFAETVASEPFTGQEKNMQYFNRILKAFDIPIKVDWKNRNEMDTVKDLIREKPTWLHEANSCFTVPYRKPGFIRGWVRRAPTFPLRPSQCGSCVKCRLTNIARICYDKALQEKTRPEDIRAYLISTDQWLKVNYERLFDMVSGSFGKCLARVARQHGVRLTYRREK